LFDRVGAVGREHPLKLGHLGKRFYLFLELIEGLNRVLNTRHWPGRLANGTASSTISGDI
jgi:hypothetical protein